MKLLLSVLILPLCVSLGSDPFQIMKEEQLSISKIEAQGVSLKFTTKQHILNEKEKVYVTEEIHLSGTLFEQKLLEAFFKEKNENLELIECYYLGEPVLAHLRLKNETHSIIAEIPIGIHKEPIKEELSSEQFRTELERVVFSFLQINRPMVVDDYLEELAIEQTKHQKRIKHTQTD